MPVSCDGIPRADALEKATGRALFTADLGGAGALVGLTLYSRHPHAWLRSVHLPPPPPGLVALRAQGLSLPPIWTNFPVLAENKVCFLGDAVALVAAESEQAARQYASEIQAEYQPLPYVYDIEKARQATSVLHAAHPDNRVPGARHVVKNGPVEERLAQSGQLHCRSYHTQAVEHAYIEPEAVLVNPEPGGCYRVYASCQYPFSVRRAVADSLGLPLARVAVIQPVLGGSFGGKEESIGLLAARCALLARAAGRAVRMVLSREESILISSKRHPFDIHYSLGLGGGGEISAWKAELWDNCGPYSARARNMNWRASVHAAGPYRAGAWHTEVQGLFSNHLLGGAMRGYSAPQIIFAHEMLVDSLARKLGQDRFLLRRQLCFKTGDRTATGQVLSARVPLAEMIEKTAARLGSWQQESLRQQSLPWCRVGTGMAISMRGCGLGAEYPDATGAEITVQKDGSITLCSCLAELGQGLHPALTQMAAAALGLPPERFHLLPLRTDYVQDGSSTVASRGSYAGGKALLLAIEDLNRQLCHALARELGLGEEEVRAEQGKYLAGERRYGFEEVYPLLGKWGLSHTGHGWFTPEPIRVSHENGQGDCYPDYSYSCVGVVAVVNTKTGKADVSHVMASHDIGRILHQPSIHNQVMGGIAMGIGFALMEECVLGDTELQTANLDKYVIPTCQDMPREVEIELYEIPGKNGPHGSKSLGEPATEAVGAAAACAVADAIRCEVDTLPLTPERILRYCAERRWLER